MSLIFDLPGNAVIVSDRDEEFSIGIVSGGIEINAGNPVQFPAMFLDCVIADEIGALPDEMTEFIEALFE